MNKARLLKLADHVEKLEHSNAPTLSEKDNCHFTLERYQYRCGAPACIAGHAKELWGSKEIESSFKVASRVLSLNWDQARMLFVPAGFFYQDITPQMAAKVIRHFVKTGEVDYNIAWEN